MTIHDNLARVQAMIADSCARANRDPASVTLVAISKTHPATSVLEAVAAGAQHFGENRVEEAEHKIPSVHARTDVPLTWHMIGHVQSRKAKQVALLFQVVHSVDTLKLAERLSRQMVEQGGTLDVLLEFNVSGEESKAGFAASAWDTDAGQRALLWAELQPLLALPALRVRGLMTMAPIVPDAEQARPVFRSLRGLRDALVDSFGVPLTDLSMGMTDDFPVAVEEGSTIVRVGRAIFGERQL